GNIALGTVSASGVGGTINLSSTTGNIAGAGTLTADNVALSAATGIGTSTASRLTLHGTDNLTLATSGLNAGTFVSDDVSLTTLTVSTNNGDVSVRAKNNTESVDFLSGVLSANIPNTTLTMTITNNGQISLATVLVTNSTASIIATGTGSIVAAL